jgi:hypothetical protein
VGDPEPASTEPPQRTVGYVCGQWRVAYVPSGEADGENDVRHGVIVGPLVADVSTAIWVAVVPDGSNHRTMIHRDSITSIAPLSRGR